ncbi:MAG: carbon-nitrogen hydrolase family protein [Dongiaceae bacterium]
MAETFKVALVQNCAERDMAPSIAALETLIRAAAKDGAHLIQLPELATMIEPDNAAVLAKTKPEADDPGLAKFRALASELKRWIHVGSLLIRESGRDKVVNRSFMLDPDGKVTARYDKIHLFDVAIKDGQSYRESATVEPGTRAVIAHLPWGRMGLTICYDLRFPHLYRALAQGGAAMIGIPAAFTHKTGEAHWHVLVRARAIETGAFVFSATQCGTHAEGRRTFGHSLIVDPWGEVLADAGDDVGTVSANIDLAKVDAVRAMIPSLQHDRPFSGPVAVAARDAAE